MAEPTLRQLTDLLIRTDEDLRCHQEELYAQSQELREMQKRLAVIMLARVEDLVMVREEIKIEIWKSALLRVQKTQGVRHESPDTV